MADVGEIKYIASIDTSAYKKGAKDIDDANKNIEKTTDNAEKSTGRFGKSGAAAFGLISGAAFALANKAISAVSNSIDAAIKRVDTLNNAPQVLQNLGFSAIDSAKAIKTVDKGVQGLPTSLDAIASSLVSIASSSGLSIDKATDLTIAFNNMALAGGKGPQEAQRALVQFTQALGKGTIPAQEFNTLMEVMPAQMTQVAKTLLGAESNAYQLRDAMSDGRVTIDQFNNTVVKLNKDGGKNFASFEKQAKSATGGIATSWQLVQTAITRGLGNIIKEIGSNNITNAFSGFRNAVDTTFASINGLIGFVKNNGNFFISLATAIGTAGTAIVLFTVYAKAASIAVAAYTAASSFLTLTLSLQAQGLGVLRAAWLALNIVMNLNPVGLVIGAVSALVGILTYLTLQTNKQSDAEKLVNQQRETSILTAQRLKTAENDLTGARKSEESAALAVERATRSYNESVRQYGKESLEAREQAVNLRDANDRLKESQDKVKTATQNVTAEVGNQKREMDDLRKKLDNMNGKSFNYTINGVQHVAQDYGKQGKFLTPTFATGGFTGRGGKYDEAGIVHRGEYVLPQSMVNQSTGLPNAQAMDSFGSGSTTSNSNTYNITIPITGAIVTSPQDQRKFAEVIGKKINEVMQQKGFKPALEGM